ncbi:hypothetical protein DAE74_23460 [Salmonella enterica subsp. enterica serovar Newport]|nr:hypothetical protein [Salmonella enterica subsp. enterica serovar Newport]
MKKNTIFEKLAIGCCFISYGSIVMIFYLYHLINLNPNPYTKNISKQEIEQFNQWLLSLNNPYIHISLLFIFLALFFVYLHCKRKKENK